MAEEKKRKSNLELYQEYQASKNSNAKNTDENESERLSNRDLYMQYTASKLLGNPTSKEEFDERAKNLAEAINTRMQDFTKEYDSFFNIPYRRKDFARNTAKNLETEANEIKKLLNDYGMFFDDDYVSEATEFLNGVHSNLNSGIKHWSQWETRDDYDADVRMNGYYTKYQGMSVEDEAKAIKDLELRYAEASAAGSEEVKALQEELGYITVNSKVSKAGWGKYILDKMHKNAKERREKEEESFGETILRYLSNNGTGTVDTTLPTSLMTQTISDIRADDSYKHPNEDWTEAQERMFGYLYYFSPDQAYKYAEELNYMIAAEKEGKAIEDIQNSATSGFWAGAGHSLGSLGTSYFGLADYLNDIAMASAGRPIAPDGVVSPFEYSQAVQSAITTKLNDMGGTLDEDIPIIGGKGWGDVYGLGMSAAKSVTSAYTLGQGSLISFFGQGAAAGVDDAKSRGATDEQALLFGAASGTAEAVFEMLPINNLLKAKNIGTKRQILFETLKHAGIEDLEETGTGLANFVSDCIIMGSNSNLSRAVKKYQDEGLPYDKALKKALWDATQDVLWDGISGFLSGIPSGGISATYQGAKNAYAGSQIKKQGDTDAVIKAGLDASPNSQAFKLAEKASDKLTTKGKAPNMLLGALKQTTTEDVINQYRNRETLSESEIRTKLESKGIDSKKAAEFASIIAKQTSGKKLSEVEKETLKSNEDAQAIANEIATAEAVNNFATRVKLAEIDSLGRKAAPDTPDTYEVSEKEGKTFIKDSKAEVEIVDIASIENGKMMLNVKENTEGAKVKEVNAENIAFATNEEAILYEAIAQTDIDAKLAKTIIGNFDAKGNLSARNYIYGAYEAYTYGKYNYPVEEMSKDGFSVVLTQKQKEDAYRLGQIAHEKNVNAKESDIKKAIDEAKKSNNVQGGKKGKVHYEGVETASTAFTERQKTSVKALETIAKALGVDIYLYESKLDDKGRRAYTDKDGNRITANGWYDTKTGDIHIDINAGQNGEGVMLFTAAHELTHFVRQWSPAKFKVLADFLMAEYGKAGVPVAELVRAQQDLAASQGRKISYDTAYEEMIADSMQTMLSDGAIVEKLTKLAQKDKNLVNKMKEWLDKFVAKIKEAYTGMTPDSKAGEYGAMLNEAERLQELFYDALVSAGENYRGAGGKIMLRDVVEETADLIAIHNISPTLLIEALNRRSLVMPSLAITNKGLTAFGEISLLFNKDTIDPNLSAENKLFGSDAWTPQQNPLKKNAKFDTDKTIKTVNNIKTRIGTKYVQDLFDVTTKQFMNAIISADGSIFDAYAHNIGMQTAYAKEQGIISKIPTRADGTVDKTALQAQLDSKLDTDREWGKYRRWLNNISDTIVTSYDNASNSDILNNMKAQPDTAKPFKLTENGELVVPAVEYSSIDDMRKNKNRLSTDAETATKAVAQKFLSLAQQIAQESNISTKDVVNAINSAYAQRYDTKGIINSFKAKGIEISNAVAKKMQGLYKETVELPTQYFEAKPKRIVEINEIAAAIIPNNTSAELKQMLADNNIRYIEYAKGDDASRLESLNSFDEVKFSERNSAEEDYKDIGGKIGKTDNSIVSIDADSQSVAPMFSERTWTQSEYVTAREQTAKDISKALGVDIKTAYKYIDDINSVARLIADDRVRLDYEPNLDNKVTVLKPNNEYKYSVDMSTLCAKRLLFTGTFDAIQKALPNTVFDSEDIVGLREMMQKKGYEVACGICYVESTRREIGRITQEFIDRYKVAQENGKPIARINSSGKEVVLKSAGRTFNADKGYTPSLGDLNTTDIDLVKRDHPEVYDAYLAFMNARGQAKPKLIETRAEYKGEILKHFKSKAAVEARNKAGGLRLQSFSDFEIPHLIDMMQVVMDMSRVGLKSQAYTKVPSFAEAFGNTGVKINLSLIAKGNGLDANGNLVFDDVEGINHKEAFRLRDKFSKNVGTILVGKNDAHIIAAMADPRIDYIIPFHKSSWKESLYDALGLTGYGDYTEFQNEKALDKNRKISNFDPSEYWDYSKTGDENAQIYLQKCKDDGRIPKFPQFQSYEGYWKLLIDFKMYDNDGIGSPQEVVKPVFDESVNKEILDKYEGNHRSFPVAKDVVDEFVKQHKDSEIKLSARDYSYEALTSKPDMKITTVGGTVPNNRADIVFMAKKNAASVGTMDKYGGVSVYVEDVKTNVLLGTDGLKHGLRRNKKLKDDANSIVTLKAGEILKNSIRINELNPSKENASGSYVLIGAAQNKDGDLYIVRFVVNQFNNELASMDVLYAINAKKSTAALNAPLVSTPNYRTKKELAALNAPRSTAKPLSVTNSTISIAELLDYVNKYFPDVLPESVLRHYQHDRRPEGELGENALYSERDSEGNTLTEAQQEYFKDSKVRDAEGRLLIVHRGSPEDFGTVFKFLEENLNSKDKPNTFGFFFTDSYDTAEYYSKARGNEGDIKSVYLNIKKPLDLTSLGISSTEKDFYRLLEENGVITERSRYKQDYKPVWTRFDKNGEDLRRKIESAGFDGVVYHDWGENKATYVAFSPEQIKLTTNTNPTSDPDIRYSSREIIGASGTNYGIGVYLDSQKLDGLSKEERIAKVVEHIKNLGGYPLSAFDNDGNEVKIKIAPKTKYKNEKGNPERANRHLTNYLDNEIKQEALLLIDEVIGVANFKGKEPATHPHGWLDNSGKNEWEIWTTYIQDKENTIWEAKLKIANTTNGEKVLYDVYPIEMVEQVGTMTTSTTGERIPQDTNSVKQNPDVLQSARFPSNAENIAKEHFGTTNKWSETGWLLKDGTQLDFSGRHWQRIPNSEVDLDESFYREKRNLEHYDIAEPFSEFEEMTDMAHRGIILEDFLNRGNIRVVGKGAVDISVMPTEEQFKKLYNYFSENVDKYIVVGIGKGDLNFREGTSASTIIESIRDFFEKDKGKMSDLMRFHVSYSERDPNAISNRSLLANALENAATNDIEKNKLKQYKEKIDFINAEERKLADLNRQLKELRFSKGKRDNIKTKQINDLQAEATKTANRISIYDKQLLNLESTTALKNVLEREKAKARKLQKQRDAEILKEIKAEANATIINIMNRNTESRKRAVEGRHKTVVRNKIKRVIKDLNSVFNKGTKERNVKIGLRDTVRKALEASEVLFSDEITNEDIVRLGVDSVSEQDKEKLEHYANLLALRDTKTDAVEISRINSQISRLNRDLKDVFIRERARLNKGNVSSALDSLAEAYASLQNSDDDYIKNNAFVQGMHDRIKSLSENLNGVTIKDMSLEQLEDVYKMYSSVKHMIVSANSIFRDGLREDLSQKIMTVQGEILALQKDNKKDPRVIVDAIGNAVKSFDWNNQKPVYAFEKLGSKAFQELFWDAVKAEGVYAQDVKEAGDFLDEQKDKFKYADWDFKKAKTFKSANGLDFKLTLSDMMSIYAYSKRPQAFDHMTQGGFTFDRGSVYADEKGRKRKHVRLSETYTVNIELINEIVKTLSEEQIGYVDAVQAYLTLLGEKGNEVSRELYGIDLFTEQVYFPLKSDADYRSSVEQALNETQTQVSLKNTGMTKQTVPHANNPIVLQGFDDVVLGHIDNMSKYHSFVLPIENLRRVFDNVSRDENAGYDATKVIVESVFGESAKQYFDQYITDLNGGVHIGGYQNFMMDMFSKMKKTAVSASLSVVVQQPFAITRAMDMINPVYFAPVNFSAAKKTDADSQWEELKKYAPIAIIKEMGGFDVGSSRTTRDYIGGTNYKGLGRVKGFFKDSDYRSQSLDSFFMWGASKADEIGWSTIWKAVKREVASQHKELAVGSEEFLQKCGERFTEVIVYTQVYDSVNSRSGMMRSKRDLDKFSTSFMGEPTTTINMVENSMLKLARAVKTKDGKAIAKASAKMGRTVGVTLGSILLTSLAKSLIYAGRDDDEEDKALLERWAKHFGDSLTNDLNPLTMIPYLRDFVSIWDGWDVERPDMTIVADIVTSIKKAIDEGCTVEEALALIGNAGNAFGLPVKNLIREAQGAINVFNDITDDIEPTDIGGAFMEGWTGEESNKGEEKTSKTSMYATFVNGDKTKMEAIRAEYKTEDAYESALKQAIRENNPTLKQAAIDMVNGNFTNKESAVSKLATELGLSKDFVSEMIDSEYTYFNNKLKKAAEALVAGEKKDYEDIVRELRERYRGIYSQDEIIKAIKEVDLEKDKDTEDDKDEDSSVYSTWMIKEAFDNGDNDSAYEMINDIVTIKTENYIKEGYKKKEAESKAKASVKSTLTSYWKPLFLEAYKNKNSAEQLRIRRILVASGVYGRTSEVMDTTQQWIKDSKKKK